MSEPPLPTLFQDERSSARLPRRRLLTAIVAAAPILAGAASRAASGSVVRQPSGGGNALADAPAGRVRAREIGIRPGVLPTGSLNAITDLEGVSVGHVTLIQGDTICTGVTAILPHEGNLFQDKTPAGFACGNGFGKFTGSTQIEELGEIETPIVLTNSLSVAEGIAGTVEWTLEQTGNEQVVSVNAVVGETNDSVLNDIRARRVSRAHVVQAIVSASGGPVAEGCVGAGTGTQAFGWKGGIGTSSRIVANAMDRYTIGVLVQTNYGGILTVDGAPVGKALGRYYLKDAIDDRGGDGSVVIVIGTDAPLSDRNLNRMARRAFLGIARTGSSMANGSGDYAIAFSTAQSVRRTRENRKSASAVQDLANDLMSPLFQAVSEAVEESVYNAMLMAVSTTGMGGRRLDAISPAAVKTVLDKHRLATS